MSERCPECGAALPDTGDCWTRVHQLLEIEGRVLASLDPEDGMRAHFFAIATYQLQHPFRVTADALPVMRGALRDMLSDAPPPIARVRREIGRMASRSKVGRDAQPGDRTHIDPAWPRQWTMTAETVVTRPESAYPETVRAWALATQDDLDRALR